MTSFIRLTPLLALLSLSVTAHADLTALPPSTKPRNVFFHIGYNVGRFGFDARQGATGPELTLTSNQEVQTYGWDGATHGLVAKNIWMGGASDVWRCAYGDVLGGPEEEMVVALSNQFQVLNATTREVITSFSGVGPQSWDMCLADVTGDGKSEILTAESFLRVYSGSGTLLWSSPQFINGNIAVGQMDNDPAFEIAVSNGKVFDSVTHAVEWTFPAATTLDAYDADGDGRDELLLGIPNDIHVWDVELQSLAYFINVGPMKCTRLIDVNGDGSKEVLLGWADFPFMRIVSFPSGAIIDSIGVPPTPGVSESVDRLDVLDMDGDGDLDVVSCIQISSAKYRVVVQDLATHQVVTEMQPFYGPYWGPFEGETSGSGQDGLVVFAAGAPSGGASAYPQVVRLDPTNLALRGVTPRLSPSPDPIFIRECGLIQADQDPTDEVYVAGGNSGARLRIYNADADQPTLLWSVPVQPSVGEWLSVAGGDADGDGLPEIFAGGGTNPGCIVQAWHPGVPAPVWTYSETTPGFVSELVYGDVDSDGLPEVAAIDGSSGNIRVLNALTGQLKQNIPGNYAAITLTDPTMNVPSLSRILAGNSTGLVTLMVPSSGGLTPLPAGALSNTAFTDLEQTGRVVVTTTAGKIRIHRGLTPQPLWESSESAFTATSRIVTRVGVGPVLFGCRRHVVLGY